MITAQEGADHAIQLFLAGRLERAGEVCRDVIEHYPDHAAALYLLGLIVSGQGDFELAESLVGRALAACPDFIGARNLLASIYRSQGRQDEAVETLRQTLGTSLSTGERSGRTVLLVSPPLACGVTFLGNILLALDIRVQPPDRPDTGEYWTARPDGCHEISAQGFSHYTGHFPVLMDRAVFRFDPSVTVVMEHRMDIMNEAHDAAIMFVRDPVDACYSMYRRHYSGALSFEEFLSRLYMPVSHLPYILSGPPLLIYALYVMYWAANPTSPLFVVRFEDIKQHPVEIVRNVLEILGVERSDEQIRSAVEASNPTRLAEAGPGNKAVRRGSVFEWREHMSADQWTALTADRPLGEVCRILGYRAVGDGDSDEDLLTPPDPYFGTFLADVGATFAKAIEASGFLSNGADLSAIAGYVLGIQRFDLPDGVMVGEGALVDPRLSDGYRAAAAALTLTLSVCRYFNPEEPEQAAGGIRIGNSRFMAKFHALACLFYRTRNNLDMARMVTGLLSDVSCIRGYVSGRGSMPSTTTPAVRIKW
jgi:hypothetical protein